MGKPVRGASLEVKVSSSVSKMTSGGVEMATEYMSLKFRDENLARNRNL